MFKGSVGLYPAPWIDDLKKVSGSGWIVGAPWIRSLFSTGRRLFDIITAITYIEEYNVCTLQ